MNKPTYKGNIRALIFKKPGEKLSALDACLQLSKDSKAKSKVFGVGNNSIVLASKGQFSLRLFTQLAFTIAKEKCEEGYYQYEIDAMAIANGIDEGADQSDIGFKTKGVQTLEFWEEALGYGKGESSEQERENELDDSGIMLWRPYFQLTNGNGSSVGKPFDYLTVDMESIIDSIIPNPSAKEVLALLLSNIDGPEDSPRIVSTSSYVRYCSLLSDGNEVHYQLTSDGVFVGASITTCVDDTFGRNYVKLSEDEFNKIMMLK